MATEENPLLSLSADKQRQLANLVEDGDIEQISEQTGLSRRQVLGIGGALLASAGVGGLTADQIVQAVKADASTTDSDGNVGLPGDRVDVYADGIDSTSLSTDDQTINTSLSYSGHDIGAILEATSSGTRVEKGEFASGSTVSGSSNNDFSDNNKASFSISFSQQFSSAPTVLVTPGTNAFLIYGSDNVTGSGFDLVVRNFSTTNLVARAKWIAIGPN